MMMVMEFVMELFFTASLSLCLAYVIAHLVSMAGYVGGGDNSVDEFVSKSSEKKYEEQEDDDANDDDTDVIVVEDEDLIETVDRVENHVQVEEQSSENSDESSSNFDGVKGDADDDLVDDVKGDADDDDLVDDDKSDHEEIELKLEGLVDQSCDDERKEDGEDEVKEEVLLDDDDDDWEGIEKSEGEKLFSSASKFVGDSENSRLLANLGNEVQMQLYGLHKVAMEGPCREQAPMALMVSARAKWNAWQQLGNMSPDMAMEQYVTLLSGAIPGWMGENHQGDKDIVVSEAGESRNENIVVHHQPDLKIDRKPEELQSLGENRDTGSL